MAYSTKADKESQERVNIFVSESHLIRNRLMN